jgi:hypothetical protein
MIIIFRPLLDEAQSRITSPSAKRLHFAVGQWVEHQSPTLFPSFRHRAGFRAKLVELGGSAF